MRAVGPGAPIALGTYPTPVARIDALSTARSTLWVKRDDLTSARYGGNKVRKLEYLLGAAREAGRSRIVTIGAAGSHQVVATALYGRELGFEVEAVLVPQPASAYARENLRAALSHGLVATVAPAWALAPAIALSRWGRDAYFIPLGGSNPLGGLGFVRAARELAAQVEAGELAEPDVVVVASGSGGTAAGLAVGFEEAGLRTRVLGVAVSPPSKILRHLTRRLATKTAELEGLPRAAAHRAMQRVDVDGRWIGRGYAYPTDAGSEALARARDANLVLDEIYTAKAFACALELVRTESTKNVLFWHTLSTAPRAQDADAPPVPLPQALERLFR